MKKKIWISIGIFVVLIIFAGIITSLIDKSRITKGNEPKYCVKIVSNDESKVTYWGLGYKIIRYVEKSPSEPFESDIGVKMGSWFMKYELPNDNEYNINNLDDFYNTKLTQNKDIRKLGKDYSIIDAEKDDCFIIGVKTYNENLYDEFIDKYNKKENAFIRVVQSTVEGDIFIIDLLYDAKNNKVHMVKDDTRDKFSAQEDQTIKYTTYEKLGKWNYQNRLYWIAYNKELPNDNEAENLIDSGNLFIIATIN